MFDLRWKTRREELARGSYYTKMRSPALDEVANPHESARAFTDGLACCVAIGRLALLDDGTRLIYMQHAAYTDVCYGRIVVRPHRAEGTVASRGIVMAYTSDPLPNYRASDGDIPYDEMGGEDNLRLIVEAMTVACDSADAVTIVPYWQGSHTDDAYAGALVLDAPPGQLGTMIAEGRLID